jgi:hypothetical protein
MEDVDFTFDGAALPDVLANFGQRSGCSGGTKALMIAVMEDGIRCFVSPDDELRLEAEEWFASEERGYVFAFLTICDALDLNGAAVREALNAMREQNGFIARRAIRTRPNVRRRGCIRPNRKRRRNRATASAADNGHGAEEIRQAVNG